jgi:DNA-binding MurR/RpiR family transcriptional regulator
LQRIEVARETMGEDNILRSVLSEDIQKLQITRDECDEASFNEAVEAILRANHIYIVGMRSSSSLANFLGFYLNLLRENVHIIRDTALGEVYEQIVRIQDGDVFIGITFPRYSSRAAKAMQYAKHAGARCIGITDGVTSPFFGVADTLICAKSDMVSFLDSLVAPMSLINALIVSVGVRSKENLSSTFKRLETIWADYDVYANTEN